MKKHVSFTDFWEGIMLRRASLTNSVLSNTIMPIKKTAITLFHTKQHNVSSLAQLGLYFSINHEYNYFKN